MATTIKYNKFCTVLCIVLLMVFAGVSYASPGLQHIVYNVVVPAVFVLSFVAVPDFRMNASMRTLFVLYAWIAFTSLTAVDPNLAFRQLRQVFGCLLMITGINQLAKNPKNIIGLYIIFLVYYLGIVYYAYTHILSVDYDYSEDRLDDSILGANTVAYFTFYTTYVIFILADIIQNRRWRKFFRILFLTMPVWSFAIAILTASRQVFIIQAPLILVLLYIRYLRRASPSMKVTALVVGIFLFLILGRMAIRVYENSMLQERNEQVLEDDPRSRHMRNAIRVVSEHPLVGVGPGNYGKYVYGHYTFTHSTYLELMANTGFPGLIIFVVLVFGQMHTQWKRYRRTRDPAYALFFIFSVFFALDNVFYVFYNAPWLMSFFFLVNGHAEGYYRRNHMKDEALSAYAYLNQR